MSLDIFNHPELGPSYISGGDVFPLYDPGYKGDVSATALRDKGLSYADPRATQLNYLSDKYGYNKSEGPTPWEEFSGQIGEFLEPSDGDRYGPFEGLLKLPLRAAGDVLGVVGDTGENIVRTTTGNALPESIYDATNFGTQVFATGGCNLLNVGKNILRKPVNIKNIPRPAGGYNPRFQFQRLDDAPNLYGGAPIRQFDAPRGLLNTTTRSGSQQALDKAKNLWQNRPRPLKAYGNWRTANPKKAFGLEWGPAAYGAYNYLTGDPNQDLYNEDEEGQKTLKFSPKALDYNLGSGRERKPLDDYYLKKGMSPYEAYQDSLSRGLIRD